MSSLVQSRYVTHIVHMTVSQILSQMGIDRCSKGALQILSDVFAFYLRHLSLLLAEMSVEVEGKSKGACLSEGILMLLFEVGFSQRSLKWDDVLLFADRQIFLSKQYYKSSGGAAAAGKSSNLFALLAGLPTEGSLHLEGISRNFEAAAGSAATDDGTSQLYAYLPAQPTAAVPAAAAACQAALIQPAASPSSAAGSSEYFNWTIGSIAQHELLALQQPSQQRETFLAKQPLSRQPAIWGHLLAAKKCDKVGLIERKIFRQPLWLSGEAQLLQFFAASQSRRDAIDLRQHPAYASQREKISVEIK